MSEEEIILGKIRAALKGVPTNKYRPLLQKCLRDVRKLSQLDVSAKTLEKLQSIPLYVNRADKRQRAIDFFHENYSDLLSTGELYSDDLHHHDRKLYGILASYQNFHGRCIGDLLPKRGVPVRHAGGRQVGTTVKRQPEPTA